MQCPSCRFENMPQYTTCVRCGSILPGAEVVGGVQPPRAGQWEKRLRFSRWIRFFNRVGNWFAKTARVNELTLFRTRSVRENLFALFWRAAVPGLPQLYRGMHRHALIFFFGWLTLLLISLITYGLLISTFLLGLVISFHLSSIISAVIVTTRERPDRIVLAFVMLLGAGLLFYTPATLLLWRYSGLYRITATTAPFQNGDALIFAYTRDDFQPQAGQAVLYTAPDVTYQTGGYGNAPQANHLFGPMFDRVLAVAGQTVAWKGGQLFVDEQPSPWKPLGRLAAKPPDTTFVVPNGCCLVVPVVAFRQLNMPTNPEDWQRVTVVRNSSIYGSIRGVRRSLLHFVDLTQNAEEETFQRP